MHATRPGHIIPLLSIVLNNTTKHAIILKISSFLAPRYGQEKRSIGVIQKYRSPWKTLISESHFCEGSQRTKQNNALADHLVTYHTSP